MIEKARRLASPLRLMCIEACRVIAAILVATRTKLAQPLRFGMIRYLNPFPLAE
jgi:hypothetical protein